MTLAMLDDGFRRGCIYIIVYLGFFASNVLGELCEYKRSVYNIFTNSYDKDRFTKECQWGCCFHHNSPCCSVPMTLIIGCILGGLGVFSLLVLAIFCGMYCKRKATNTDSRSPSTRSRSRSQGQSRDSSRRDRPPTGSDGQMMEQDSVFYSNSSSSAVMQNVVMNEQPPSYEEVMQGIDIQSSHSNTGFKSEEDSP